VDRKLEVFTMHASKQKSGQPMKILQPAFEPLLDSDEAAALLKIHPKTLQRLARTGEIRGLQVGKLWRFRVSVLNAWLDHKTTW
jgi:excisionase family DNA binding protein